MGDLDRTLGSCVLLKVELYGSDYNWPFMLGLEPGLAGTVFRSGSRQWKIKSGRDEQENNIRSEI